MTLIHELPADWATNLTTPGARIRAGRIARGWTQEQLAEAADVGVQVVKRAEQGGRLYADTLARLADALGCTMDWLYAREG